VSGNDIRRKDVYQGLLYVKIMSKNWNLCVQSPPRVEHNNSKDVTYNSRTTEPDYIIIINFLNSLRQII
jgi:hypothetical protein